MLEVCKLNEIKNQYFSGYRGLGVYDRGLVGVCISVTRAKKERVWVHNGSQKQCTLQLLVQIVIMYQSKLNDK